MQEEETDNRNGDDDDDDEKDYDKKSDTAEDFSDITELAEDLQTAMQVCIISFFFCTQFLKSFFILFIQSAQRSASGIDFDDIEDVNPVNRVISDGCLDLEESKKSGR